jgi:hypothetical protein
MYTLHVHTGHILLFIKHTRDHSAQLTLTNWCKQLPQACHWRRATQLEELNHCDVHAGTGVRSAHLRFNKTYSQYQHSTSNFKANRSRQQSPHETATVMQSLPLGILFHCQTASHTSSQLDTTSCNDDLALKVLIATFQNGKEINLRRQISSLRR